MSNDSNLSSDSSPTADHDGLHVDKYNDPRAQITRRGVLMGVAVAVLAVFGAAGSIYARKVPLEKSTDFWGQDTITALQLAERIELLPRGNETFSRVELTTTPGLGHLRRALLDQRNYDWASIDSQSVADTCLTDLGNEGSADQESVQPGRSSNDQPDDSRPAILSKLNPSCIQLRLTDPTAHRFDTILIDLNLAKGWAGPGDGSQRVRFNDHVQPKLKSYFATIINVKELQYDLRD